LHTGSPALRLAAPRRRRVRAMSLHLGLDLGGTNIKAAVIADASTPDPRLVGTLDGPTHAEQGPDAVIERLVSTGHEAVSRFGTVSSVGVGVPGLFDARAGTIRFFPNLPGPWEGKQLVAPLHAALGVPVSPINDARAFVLAEARAGAGRGCSTLVGMVLGTGVGGGVVVGGRLHLGLDGTAGEIGHQTVIPDGPVCGCGNRGCVEAVASAHAIAAAAGRPTVAEAAVAARAGDRRAQEAFERAGMYLGIAVANAIVLLSPERVVVGGGVAAAGDLLLAPIRREVTTRVRIVPVERIAVVEAELGPHAGAIGDAIWGADALEGLTLDAVVRPLEATASRPSPTS
jgi:glucokinase